MATRHESWLPPRKARAFADSGAHRAYLEVTVDNAAARVLYQREGFVLEGTLRDGYHGMDGTFRGLCAYGILARDCKRLVNVER